MSEKGLGSFDKNSKQDYQQGINYLFIIGINKYKHCRDLNNAVKDVVDFRDLMLERFPFEKEHCVELLDGEATKRNIYKKINFFKNKMHPNDNLVIYFSGHGEYEEGEGFWVPTEAEREESDYIPNVVIKNKLEKLKIHHLFLIVDSCFSGALFIKDQMRNTAAAAERKEKDPSRWGLTSGKLEPVPDGEKGKNSPFATILLHQLRQSESMLRVGRLCDQVLESLAANAKQTPLGQPLQIKGHQNGEFVFHIKKDEQRDFALAKVANNVASYTAFLAAYPNGTFAETAHWNIACLNNRIPAYADYQERFPKGQFYKTADEKIEKLEDEQHWTAAKNKDTIAGYNRYLKQHPHGQFVEEANSLRKALLVGEMPVKAQKPVEKKISIRPKKPIDTKAKERPKPKQPTFFELHWKKLLATVIFILAMLLLWKACGNTGEGDGEITDKITISTDSSQATKVNTLKSILTDISSNMVELKKASFMMGDDGAKTREKPAHKVKIPAFAISKYEVTNEQYVAFLNDKKASTAEVKQWINLEGKSSEISKIGNTYKVESGKEKYPIRYISWHGAKAFCTWLSKKTGKKYRLPSEAEWEYAARANQNMTYSGSNNLDEVGWYRENSGKRTHKRGELKPNAFGLYDMSGNVWEWCEDIWHDNYIGAPDDGSAWVDNKAAYRVIRGGDYWNNAIYCRSAFRDRNGADSRFNGLGFRLAFSPVQ